MAGSAGTAATALAVSCEPTATSGTPSRPGRPRTAPRTVPGATGVRKSEVGTPMPESSDGEKSRVCRSTRPEVEAIVASREVQQRRGLGALGVQLEDRVEVHELDAGRVVEGALADEVEDGLGVHGGVAAVAVDVGQAEEAAGPVQQAVVHAPRVDADGGDLAVLRGGGAEAGADVLQQLREVPEEVSGELDGRVVEAGDDLHRELRAVVARGDDAAAAGAEVDRKVGFHSDFLP